MESKFVGEIIRESLVDPAVLWEFEPYLIKSRIAQVQNFDPPIWHVEPFQLILPLDRSA